MDWDSSLESDIPVIDHEHKQLVEQLSRLIDAANPEQVREMIDFLKEYVVKHFAHEQLMHKKLAYPKAASHKSAHVAFVDTFLQLEEEYVENGCNPEILGKVINIVSEWLVKHIKGEDMGFSRFFKDLVVRGEIQLEDYS